ncbi:YggT family protein [Prochlorococcus marinus]|uniref:YggT family protein n=1 Tax=Prochlorococcus marinus TaxID=1219 RepID=UPI0022B5B83A|nr:YggT family protein [Prochlorococcus marinus]
MVIAQITQVLFTTITLYNYLLIIRILLTWFPNLDTSNPILTSLFSITDPYLNVFRGVIPPIGGLDLSPILAFISLSLIKQLVVGLGSLALQYSGTF